MSSAAFAAALPPSEAFAEIRAIRALYYFVLFDLWRNIPLEISYADTLEPGYLPEQSAPEHVWDFLAKDDPEQRMKDLLNDQLIYAPIYQRVLEACAASDGASAQLLADLVDSDPLLEKPRRWSSFFTKRLEDCESINWRGAWKITEIGRKAQAILSEIIAAQEAEAAEAARQAELARQAEEARKAEEAQAAQAAEAAAAEAAAATEAAEAPEQAQTADEVGEGE